MLRFGFRVLLGPLEQAPVAADAGPGEPLERTPNMPHQVVVGAERRCRLEQIGEVIPDDLLVHAGTHADRTALAGVGQNVFSGEVAGPETSRPERGSSTSQSRQNSAAERRIGYTRARKPRSPLNA